MSYKKNTPLPGATIKDVAQLADVSIATVSRMLNGKSHVSPVLAKRVESAVKQLGYRPNTVARALKVRESHSIGLIIPDIENPFFPAMVRGVEDAAKLHDYAVILCNTDGKPDEEEKYIKFLYSKQVDGIVFTGGKSSGKNVALLDALSIPVVLLDRRASGVTLSSITTDNRLGAFMATEHLLQIGRRDVAFAGELTISSGLDRRQGYLEALAKNNVPSNLNLVIAGEFTFEGGYQAASRLLAGDAPFDAVFAANDMMAIGVIEYLYRHGVRVPGDVAVVGYDDIHMAAWYKPALTTVRQPVYTMGQHAVRTLLEHLTGARTEYCDQILKPELIVRQSSGREGGSYA